MFKEKAEFLPFSLEIKAGSPVSEQLVFAFKKALVTGLLKPGNKFPSVRAVSQELRIHPNTAHKAIAALVDEGFLEVYPGIGTVVAKVASLPSDKQILMLREAMEHLVVEAKNQGLKLDELKKLMDKEWKAAL